MYSKKCQKVGRMKKIYIVIGMSGSGKTTVMKTLSDEGYVILENLSENSLENILSFLIKSDENKKIAVILNVRDKDDTLKTLDFINEYDQADIEIKRILLNTSDQVLINRYQEFRKIHPLIKENQTLSLEQAISIERNIAEQIEFYADFIVDTSELSTTDLNSWLINFLEKNQTRLTINLSSFGFKYGIPRDSDMIFDVRFLVNPFYQEELRMKSGLDQIVYDYVFSFDKANEFFDKIKQLIKSSIEGYIQEGRMLVNISIGCTGGKHRSVSFVQRLKKELPFDNIQVKHIENNRGTW